MTNSWLSPWWLLAIFAFVIPLTIHFFSKSKAPLISFAQFTLIPIKQSTIPNAMRLSEWLLLALRILILLLLSLLLAQCIKPTDDDSKVEYFIVSNDWLAAANQQQKETFIEEFNQLSKASKKRLILLNGSESSFDPDMTASNDYQPGTGYKSNHQGPITLATLDIDDISRERILSGDLQLTIWQQVANFSATHPHVLPANIQVFATNHLAQFNNERVAVPANINWHILKTTDVPNNKLISKILLLSSDKKQPQIDYLRAAFNAIITRSEREIQFDVALPTAFSGWTELAQYDWIFYLGDLTPTPDSLDKLNHYVLNGGQLFLSALNVHKRGNWLVNTPHTSVSDSIIDAGSDASTPDTTSPIRLSQIGESPTVLAFLLNVNPDSEQETLWQTPDQQNVLTRTTFNTPNKNGQIMTFYSRFEANWTDWVTHLDFPFALDNVLNERLYRESYLNNAHITEAQIISDIAPNHAKLSDMNSADRSQIKHTGGTKNKPLEQRFNQAQFNRRSEDNTQFWLLTLLIAAFCTERVWSEYKPKASALGREK
nr:BatA domain-containing protein [Paraglaciecola sp. 20A4]